MSRTEQVLNGPEVFSPTGHSRQTGALLARTHIKPVLGRRWRDTTDWQIAARRIADSMWIHVVEGGVDIEWGENLEHQASLEPGDLCLLPTEVQHAARVSPGHAFCVQDSVHFHALLDSGADLTRLLEIGGVYRQPADIFTAASYQFVRELALQAPGWEIGAKAAVRQILLEILRQTPAVDNEDDYVFWQADARLRPVFKLLERRLADPALRVSDLAQAANIGQPWLRKLFREATGRSPLAELRHRRITVACSLLSHSRDPIKVIAAKCGMPDPLYFHRCFRESTGMTPTEWRQRKCPEFAIPNRTPLPRLSRRRRPACSALRSIAGRLRQESSSP